MALNAVPSELAECEGTEEMVVNNGDLDHLWLVILASSSSGLELSPEECRNEDEKYEGCYGVCD